MPDPVPPLGADRSFTCATRFAGADTLATARALAMALRRESFDLILCGRNSVDAETGQVVLNRRAARSAAGHQCTHPQRRSRGGQLTAERETDDGFEL